MATQTQTTTTTTTPVSTPQPEAAAPTKLQGRTELTAGLIDCQRVFYEEGIKGAVVTGVVSALGWTLASRKWPVLASRNNNILKLLFFVSTTTAGFWIPSENAALACARKNARIAASRIK
eukprot:TRINITY_DN1138_c0_g1_i1.p1 TRINITY_DN1138_c0_g1~~TRINITY_DN1138_c0_g1_i1.p1  ORF type:complete len:120 (-),score=30.26 TRINITY_DN1138_c0_g1_i1:172-531(-)